MVAKFAFALATSGVLGLHRDEFYYLASGRHLSWGYVDNPPLVPWIYAGVNGLLGHSALALGMVPALCGAAYILVAVLLVAEVGGGRSAQLLVAAAAALGPVYLTTAHFLSTVDIELLAAGTATWLIIRLIRTGQDRLWLAVGAVVGVGLLDKYTLGLWLAAAIAGLLIAGPHRALLTPWAGAGAVVAAALVAPSLAWQAQHHWAILTFTSNLARDNGTSDRVQFLPLQLGIVTLAGTVAWVSGARHAWKGQARWLTIGFLLSAVVLLVAGGKAYYLADWYLPLLGVGAAHVEAAWAPRGRRWLLGAVVVTGLVSLPLFTPVLPASATVALGLDKANNDLGAMLGWSHVAGQIATVDHALPPAERPGAIILTQDYSEAGAVDLYATRLDIPNAISGHNSYWPWGYGYPRADAAVIAVGIDAALLNRDWSSVTRVSTLGRDSTPVDPQERGTPIYLCRTQRVPWATIWPTLRHYD
ncbi:MAG: glycosyltransferase family 39 protein [Acidimicrobiales bacterium]